VTVLIFIMTKKIAIIILNYKTPNLVVDCLHSLKDQIEPGISVLVVDNASNDDSAEYIENNIVSNDWQNWARLICSPINGGFAAGNNYGIRSVNADAYILLNSDVIVLPGAIKELIKAMEKNSDAGLIGPGIQDQNGNKDASAFHFIHPVTEFVRTANTGVISRLFQRYNTLYPRNEPPVEPDWIGFACVLIPRHIIDDIGLLDDGFFMYFEDVDYCHRVHNAGWKILYWPKAQIIHLLGGSGNFNAEGTLQKRAPRFYYEARSRYFAKHYGYLGLWFANVNWVIGRMISFLREVIGNKTTHHRENEAYDIWINILRPFRTPTLPVTNKTIL
jgi:N-acetylglucosaminyl-diphospho-decaprenol L-rhamnosyltransferase